MSLDNPSYKDCRGEIRKYEFQGVKFNVLFTKKGFLRSGDYHPVNQYDLILKGRVKITLRQNDEDVVIYKGVNELIAIPPGVPHLFGFLEDTVMIEWWDGEFECEYYEPYRKIIEKQFKENEE